MTLLNSDRTVPFVIQQPFQDLYSTKTDEELMALAADSASLRQDAKLVLAQELQRRNLQPPPSHQVDQQSAAGGKFRAMPSALKFSGFLAMNVIIAVIGTAGLDVSIRQAIPLHSTVALVWEEYLVSIICAGGLGFAAWRKWRSSSAKWTWALPAIWFAFGFLVISGRGPFSGRLFAPRSQSVLYDDSVRSFFRTFYAFTVPLIRGISYSLGAYLSALFGSRPSLGIRSEPVASVNVNE